ncbi:MAG: Bug family tripartite tricarboxylate transporter substrate binding protein [Beijerinckiaceae bacterium]
MKQAIVNGAFAAAFLATAYGAGASAQDLSKMSVTVGFTSGGTYDATARLFSRHYGRHLAGNPQIIVQNMPGSGGVVALNHLYNIAPKDGSALALVDGALAFEALFGNPAVKYDPRQLNWIGSRAKETPLCVVWAERSVASIDEAMKRDVVLGATVGTRTYNQPRLFNALLGTKFKIVTGYPGGNELTIAMERGETEGWCGWSWTSVKRRVPKWLTEKKVNILVQGALDKAPDLPDVPLAIDLVKNPADRQIMQLMLSDTRIASPLIAPGGVQDARVKELRDGFDKMMKDPEFNAEADKLGIEIDPTPGVQLQAAVNDMFALPPDVVNRARELLK